jgi:putative transposase
MKKLKFSESQIVNILKEAEAGVSVEDLSHQHGFSKASFYKWKARYGGMSVSEVKRMKELEEENRRLKQMYANLSLEPQADPQSVPCDGAAFPGTCTPGQV